MKLFSIKPAITLKGRSFKGVRGWTGKPSHPPLTDFPIAGYIFAAAFDVLSLILANRSVGAAHDLHIAATYAMAAGALVSIGTIVTGFWDWWKGIDRDHSTGPLGKAKHTQVWRTINWHATLMATASAFAFADLALRLGNNARYSDLTTTVLSVAAAGLISLGAFYGGELIFDFQFNVEDLKGSTAWDETEVDQTPKSRPQSDW
jgi:uncharacterized membrane protein